MLYITEIYTRHPLITPLDQLRRHGCRTTAVFDCVFLAPGKVTGHEETHIAIVTSQKGFVLVYMAAVLALLLVTTGLAVDSGRAYVVKAQLSKAVDGAALAAARSPEQRQPAGRRRRRSSRPTSRRVPGHGGVARPDRRRQLLRVDA